MHEDDDEDDDNEHNDDGAAAPAQDEDLTKTHEASKKAVPLQTISPNASPRRKQHSIDQQKVISPPQDHDPLEAISTEEHNETQTDTHEGQSLPVDGPPADFEAPPSPERLETNWTASLASIMEKQQRRTASSEHPNPAQRLKHRKLGRAASGSSLASRTNSGSATANQELAYGEKSFSDSSDSHAAAQEDLPSTQIGYETLEAEAARMQMAKRMGTSYSDESSGTRLASLGTVRDSAAPAGAPGGRSRNRARK